MRETMLRRDIDAYSGNEVRRFVRGQRFEHPAAAWLAFEVDQTFADFDALGI